LAKGGRGAKKNGKDKQGLAHGPTLNKNAANKKAGACAAGLHVLYKSLRLQ
jgi:hypothetical protein